MSKQDEIRDYYGGNPNLRNIWGKKFTIIAFIVVAFFTALLVYRMVSTPGQNFFKEDPPREIQSTK
jgi:hypothetical protein